MQLQDTPGKAGGPLSAEDALPALEAELAALWRRGRTVARTSARAIHPKLDPTAYPLLVLLFHAGELRMSELASTMGLDKSTVTRQVDAAARLGLLERATDPADARARLVTLTENGRGRVTAVLAAQRTRWRTALSTWPVEDIESLTTLLHNLGDSDIT
ncbi:MarR family winged helix-turn-helix transcriptional regulator [Actinokineospora auranticolor]|uniref:DNA-binding MarR family transcriptional regulator n=1 Tax=Actinokineospora auranticolor TaxID=155976 RepID=A0A2S6GJJ9_9PSEU|nr:MarR family winged helix-turn-helix transcriptional regulator [Actinokineospora auranticolor]PPK65370.1 DNA-binding MarR family transcriptional regulator [Actinokineospora auranticolor]